MSTTPAVKTLLLILDGWGIAPPGAGNAVASARTPNLDACFANWPHTSLHCSGHAVGLPEGFMGNSEVGHMNIGAGRVIYQDMTRIDMAIEKDGLEGNSVLAELMETVSRTDGRLHLMGLLSDGGVHSHQNHLHALLRLAKKRNVPVLVHCFMDGRDTPPTSGADYLRQLQAFLADLGWGEVATVTGRYWAMDRDNHFERVELAYRAMAYGEGQPVADPVLAVEAAYENEEYDEFIKPRIVSGVDGRIVENDAVFMFNFRADRARQLCRIWVEDDFSEFERGPVLHLSGLATMTSYDASLPVSVAFDRASVEKTLGEVVSGLGLRQLRIAETEKYAHVTYFLNGGREDPFPGEDRQLVPSPRDVATYDEKPSMSAVEVTEKLLAAMVEYDLMVCNLANLDMVGHTGVIPAVIQAVETVDACVGRLVDNMLALGGRVLLTADHGNAEEMIDENGGPQTAHSLNDVPLIYMEKGHENTTLNTGKLSDLAPTILSLWGVPLPEEMTGQSLVEEA